MPIDTDDGIRELLTSTKTIALVGASPDPQRASHSVMRVIDSWVAGMRKLTPRAVADQHVPVVTFLLLLIVYAIVTFERADLCLKMNLVGQAGCR